MPRAVNDTSVYEVPNDQNDGSTFDLPDTDGSGETDPDGDPLTNNDGEGYNVKGEEWTLVKVVNGWDVNVDVTPKGTTFDDATMDEDVDDATATTVNAGENDTISWSERYAYIRCSVAPAGDPTNGTLKLVFQSDKN